MSHEKLGPGILEILWMLYGYFSLNGNTEACSFPQIVAALTGHGAKVQQMTMHLMQKKKALPRWEQYIWES